MEFKSDVGHDLVEEQEQEAREVRWNAKAWRAREAASAVPNHDGADGEPGS